MKITILFIAFHIGVFALSAQDAKDILKKTYEKSKSIRTGHFEYTRYTKSLGEADTSRIFLDCKFERLEKDSIYSLAFHYRKWVGGKYPHEVLYTGEDFVEANADDSTATIMSKSNWAEDIKSLKHNYTHNFYEPIMDSENTVIMSNSSFTNDRFIFKYVGEEEINNTLCHRIQINRSYKGDENSLMKSGRLKVLRTEWHVWVSKSDFIPVQYSTFVDLIMDNETQHQYENFILSKYEINSFKNEEDLTLNSIPKFYRMKSYSPYQFPELLEKNIFAPNWKLSSVNGEIISLSDLKGKMVLIDFFFKECAPCIHALPGLRGLYEKYKEKGLQIIGIDPVDKSGTNIKPFLEGKGITYPVLLDKNYEVAKTYQVSYYPTVYLIDREGKIIYSHAGYSTEAESVLEKIIIDSLD